MTKALIGSILAASAIALPAAVTAQPDTAAAVGDNTMFFVSSGAPLMPFGGTVDVLRGEASVIGAVVKDKPYSADAVTESTQILADGNRITSRNEARMYRDSQGRTRREQALGGLGVWHTANEPVTMITINDPIADVSYFLDPVARIARELKPFRMRLGGDATWERAVPAPPPDGAGPVDAVTRVMVTRRLEPGEEPPQPFELPLPPPPELAAGAIAVRGVAAGVAAFAPTAIQIGPAGSFGPGQATIEDLGEQVLEGVLARGSRTTQTIAAGAIGNERPIEIVSEQWYSDEIEAVVSRRNFDPRFGETTYRLVNLVRNEPSPDLFTVPQGYERRTEPEPQQLGFRAPGPGAEPAPGARVERRVFVVEPDPSKAAK